MKIFHLLVLLCLPSAIFGQDIDTLSFYSQAFEQQRTVYVHTPQFYQYKSDSVKLPVIYLLDGQHEWYINPILSDIQYLQYTHEIPQAIIVVIPHQDRYKECDVVDLETELPLDIFITKELERELSPYQPGAYKLIMGHSFSASFSLYSYYRHPEFYAAVIAHSPLDEMDILVPALQKNSQISKDKISISIGGIANGKDSYHRKKHDQLKGEYPDFYAAIELFESDYSTHGAVPIVASPLLLSQTFYTFSRRYSEIAKVDGEYKLLDTPESPAKELEKIAAASKIGNFFYPPEIAELNGIGSRYWHSEYEDIAIEAYKLGVLNYPKCYEFHLYLYELYLKKNPKDSRAYLNHAEYLLKTMEDDWEGKNELLEEIQAERVKNGW